MPLSLTGLLVRLLDLDGLLSGSCSYSYSQSFISDGAGLGVLESLFSSGCFFLFSLYTP